MAIISPHYAIDDIADLDQLSPSERAEFDTERALFHRAAAEGMQSVRDQHEKMVRAGLMDSSFQLIAPRSLVAPSPRNGSSFIAE
ncbi:hypothetical protein [Silvibacterium sp.]|uniref:hypothetical protein n=1 Tax=Silvibacterium sp. TaxID=1964179 RepID=UPI0039E46715